MGDVSLPRSGLKAALPATGGWCWQMSHHWAAEVSGNRLDVLSGKQHRVLQGNEYVFPAFKRTLASGTWFCKAESEGER